MVVLVFAYEVGGGRHMQSPMIDAARGQMQITPRIWCADLEMEKRFRMSIDLWPTVSIGSHRRPQMLSGTLKSWSSVFGLWLFGYGQGSDDGVYFIDACQRSI